MIKNKSFDCVKMARDIRDKLYEENKGKSLKEFADNLIKEAHNSLLWGKINLVSKNKK